MLFQLELRGLFAEDCRLEAPDRGCLRALALRRSSEGRGALTATRLMYASGFLVELPWWPLFAWSTSSANDHERRAPLNLPRNRVKSASAEIFFSVTENIRCSSITPPYSSGVRHGSRVKLMQPLSNLHPGSTNQGRFW